MILYPAIDLKDVKAVRLLRGDMDKATVFNDDPADQARSFVEAGCEWLHLVDLNGAFVGGPVNAGAVEAILAATAVPTQLGGGIRDMKTIESWLNKGLARVILGTAAVEDPKLVREAADAFSKLSLLCGNCRIYFCLCEGLQNAAHYCLAHLVFAMTFLKQKRIGK